MPNLITQRYSDEELEQMRASLRDSLEKTDKGGTANSIRNCVIVFENDPLFAGKIMRNLLTETDDMIGEFPWRRDTTRFDDQDLPHVLLHFEQYYGIRSEKCVQNAFRVVASAHGFHPIRNYLRKLRWDGNYRIRYALHHFLGAEVNDYNEACLQLFMLGAVKRIFEPGAKFDLMLVLTGGQGAGKSTFLRFLAVRDEEMVATANAKSIEDIKSFLSRSKDTYKFPYDRYAADHLRQCVFAGTTNKMDFLPMDRSGNRRFLPVQVHPEQAETHILADEEASRAYIDLMWAEIMAIYESGEYSIHLTREMEEKQAMEQKKYMQEDTRAGQIYGFMETYPGDKLCSKQLYKEALDHPYDEPKQWETREIFEIVNVGIANGSIQGWRPYANSRRFEKYGTQRGWERIPAESEKESTAPVNQSVNQPVEKNEQMGFIAVEPGEDFPF